MPIEITRNPREDHHRIQIAELLSSDHNRIRQLLDRSNYPNERIMASGDPLFQELREMIEAYTLAEEQIVYRQVAEDESAFGFIEDLRDHHSKIEGLLVQLDFERLGSGAWGESYAQLKEEVAIHIREEEERLFPLLSELFSSEERYALGVLFCGVKDRIGLHRSLVRVA